MEIWNAIKEIRLEKGLTQTVIADAINVDVSVVSNIERGKRPLKFDEVEKIAQALKIPIVNLVDYPNRYVRQIPSESEVQTVLQIRLSKKKRDEILRQVLGDIDIINNL